MHICRIFLYSLGSLSLITCARNNASEAAQKLLLHDEDDEFQELKKEDITTVPVSLEAIDELYNYWSEQGFSAIMASVADQRLQELSATERKQHQKCAHRAHTVENHAKCVSKVLRLHEAKEKARKKFGDFKTFDFIKTKKFASIKNHRFRGKPLSERATRKNLMLLDHHKELYSKELKTRRKPLFGDRKVNPEWENFKQQQSERRKLKRKLKKIPKKDHNTEEGEWVGGFRLRAKRSINDLDQNEVPTLVHQRYSYVIPDENRLNPFGRLMRKLTNTVQLVKNKPVDNRRWQDRVLEIKQVGEKLQQKESARTAFQKRMETIQDTAKSLQFDMRKPLQLLGFFEKIGADINNDIGKFASHLNPATDLSEFNNDNRIDDEFMEPSRYRDDPVDMGDRPPESDKEKAIRLPMQLIRDGVKLGMSLSGKDTKNFEKKTIRLFSPKILEVAPGPRDNDTINLLSPKLLTMHNETTDDIEKMLSIQGAMKFMQDLNQQEMMNFILEASGVGDVIAKMKDADKAEDTLEKAGLDPRVFGSPELVEQFLKSMEKPRPAPDDDGLEDLDENGVKKFYADLKKEVEETKTEQDYDNEEDDEEGGDGDGEEDEDDDFDDFDDDDKQDVSEKASDNKSEEPEGSGEGSGEEELFANLDLLIMDGLIADAANVTVDEKDNKESGHHKKHRDQKHNKHKHNHHRGNGTRGHQRLNETATYKLQGPNGTLYLTKSKIKELYGEPELTRVLLFEKLHKSITKKQMEDFRKAGMTMLTPRQRRLLYGPGSPFEDKEALDRMRNITEDDLKLHLENTIHHLASKERPRDYSFRKQNRTTTKPEDLEDGPDGGPVATAKVGNYSVCIEFLSNGNCERWSPGASTKAPPESSSQRSAKLPQRRAAASGTGSAGTGGVSGSVSVCYGKGCKGGTTTPKPTTARPPPWGVIKTPVVYASVVRNSKMASQPFILSPILFSSVLFSPAVFGAIILSPWAFVATVGSPKVLSPVILSPPLWNLILLSPLVMDPILLSPGVGNPIILSPFVFTPFIISPQVMTPVILSPLVLSPIIMTPMALTPLILSPFVLTPIIMSPSYVGALVLSPSALSPGILSQGAIFTAILSPSLLS